jgi:hypothetical protein
MRRCIIPMVMGLALLVGGCGSDGGTTASSQPAAAPTTDPAIQKRLDKLEKQAADARRDARKEHQKLRRARERAKAERAKAERANAEPAPEPTQAAASGGGDITVPNVVGLDHQAAQNAMQGEGLYALDEKDCSGRGRLLLFDRNWEVVKTDPPAGTHVSEDTTITICSVKQGE